MSEHRKQAEFLKKLVLLEENPAHRTLCERLAAAEKNERCLMLACRLVLLVAGVALGGIGYSAVLLPQFFDNATHIVLRFFSALSLGSALCFLVFLGLWFWYRASTNRIHDEFRKAITAMVEARMKTTSTAFYSVLTETPKAEIPNLKVTVDNGANMTPDAELAELRKAS
jgi:hypothetical protein